jgi:hypothetical protein
MKTMKKHIRPVLMLVGFWMWAPAAFAYSFGGGSYGGGGYGGVGSSGVTPGGGVNLNTALTGADTTILLVKGVVIDVATLLGIVLMMTGIIKFTKERAQGENHHVAAMKHIAAGALLASIGVALMMFVNAIYT